MNNEQLAREEFHLLFINKENRKLREKLFEQQDEPELFQEYQKVYEKYVALISNPYEQVEAMKRAVFLQWFSVVEPPYLTLLRDLNQNLERSVLEKVQTHIENQNIDSEFEHMLAWYYQISDWYFDKFSSLGSLLDFLKRISQKLKPLNFLSKSSFVDRGQMGIYWQSVLHRQF